MPAENPRMFIAESDSARQSFLKNPKIQSRLLGIDIERNAACIRIDDYTNWLVPAGKLPGAIIRMSDITGSYEYSVPLPRTNAFEK